MSGPQAAWLADGRRLHLNHGPIDLIVEAFGEGREVELAYRQAVERFSTILTELVAELLGLRQAAGRTPRPFMSRTAQRMETAVCRLAGDGFKTPMAAVAGSVADEILCAMLAGRRLRKAYVNNGGDSALHLEPGETLEIAIAGTGRGLGDRVTITADEPVRGVATSGWRGRSHSLGIADAVTVLARDGASADAAATLIANAVDLPGHGAVTRRPAVELAPDSDLGGRLVTTGVGRLSADEVERALAAGLAVAEDFRRRGLIEGAALFLAGAVGMTGAFPGDRALDRLSASAGPEDPLSASLRSAPLPRGARNPSLETPAPFLPPLGGGVTRSVTERGRHQTDCEENTHA